MKKFSKMLKFQSRGTQKTWFLSADLVFTVSLYLFTVSFLYFSSKRKIGCLHVVLGLEDCGIVKEQPMNSAIGTTQVSTFLVFFCFSLFLYSLLQENRKHSEVKT